MIDVRFLSHKNWNVCLRKIYCRSIQNAEISNGREAFAKGGNILYLLMTKTGNILYLTMSNFYCLIYYNPFTMSVVSLSTDTMGQTTYTKSSYQKTVVEE